MTRTTTAIHEHLRSSAHLSKRHVHPKLSQLMELGGMNTAFARAAGQYLYDFSGHRYLDLLSGGGIHFVGRNHPQVLAAVREALADDLPNLCVVNASILGGSLAERLLELAGDPSGKVLFANSGAEAVDTAMRFARYVTRRPRFLYLQGAFHGRTWGAILMNGFDEMREGLTPFLPDCVAIPPNDLDALEREVTRGDVAAFVFEPVQGMTLTPLDLDYYSRRRSAPPLHVRRSGRVAATPPSDAGRVGARHHDVPVSRQHGARLHYRRRDLRRRPQPRPQTAVRDTRRHGGARRSGRRLA